MHLILPFAAPGTEGGRQALAALELPALTRLLAGWHEVARDEDTLLSLSAPHERAAAAALGWACADGGVPWAARAARADGIDTGAGAVGLLTPCHWHLGTDQVSLMDPAQLGLDEATSREFFAAVQPLLAEEGLALHFGAPLRWYAVHESLAGLRTAGLDRVIGRNVDAWLGTDPAARRVRRLQAEVQMLLHAHPANERREALGLLPVNSFWLSGCGAALPEGAAAPRVDERLRSAALAEDWAAWSKGWQGIEAGPVQELQALAAAGAAVALTLCGEKAASRWQPRPRSWWSGLRARWQRADLRGLLGGL